MAKRKKGAPLRISLKHLKKKLRMMFEEFKLRDTNNIYVFPILSLSRYPCFIDFFKSKEG